MNSLIVEYIKESLTGSRFEIENAQYEDAYGGLKDWFRITQTDPRANRVHSQYGNYKWYASVDMVALGAFTVTILKYSIARPNNGEIKLNVANPECMVELLNCLNKNLDNHISCNKLKEKFSVGHPQITNIVKLSSKNRK